MWKEPRSPCEEVRSKAVSAEFPRLVQFQRAPCGRRNARAVALVAVAVVIVITAVVVLVAL
eukprot:5451938-Alexandrium_andersonii.AAC.1